MTLNVATALLLAGLIGLSLGLPGSGGTIITLPVLVYVAGVPVSQAVGTSLAVIAFNSLAGLAGQARYVRFDWGLTVAFVGAASVGMLGGVGLGGRLAERTLRRCLACFLVIVALLLAWDNLQALQ